MTNKCWTEIRIENKSKSGTLKITDIKLSWGKIYPDGHREATGIPPGDVEGTEIKPGEYYVFRACGKNDSPDGTEGTLNLSYDGIVDQTIYWLCPWAPFDNNRFSVTSVKNSKWGHDVVSKGGADSNKGPLGNVLVEFRLYA
jgi:hypothetical protein